jgi:hypothetical protein
VRTCDRLPAGLVLGDVDAVEPLVGDLDADRLVAGAPAATKRLSALVCSFGHQTLAR